MTRNDLINTMVILVFDHYVGLLSKYICRHRESKGKLYRPTALVDMPPPSNFALGHPPTTTDVVTEEMEAPTIPQPIGSVLAQQPPCDFTVLGLHIDVYMVFPAEASLPPALPLMPSE
jgi:hypothetical protein